MWAQAGVFSLGCDTLFIFLIMKTVLITILLAVAGLTMLAATYACKNTKNQQENVQCGGPGIGIDLDTVEALSLPPIEEEVERDDFTVGLPEGWKVMSNDEYCLIVYKGTIEEDYLDGRAVHLVIVPADGVTPDDAIQEMVTGINATVGKDVTIGATTYQTCTYVEDGRDLLLLVTKYIDKLMRIEVEGTDASDPEVRAIVLSMRIN